MSKNTAPLLALFEIASLSGESNFSYPEMVLDINEIRNPGLKHDVRMALCAKVIYTSLVNIVGEKSPHGALMTSAETISLVRVFEKCLADTFNSDEARRAGMDEDLTNIGDLAASLSNYTFSADEYSYKELTGREWEKIPAASDLLAASISALIFCLEILNECLREEHVYRLLLLFFRSADARNFDKFVNVTMWNNLDEEILESLEVFASED